MKTKTKDVHFRCDTPKLFKEIVECTLSQGKNGIFKIPLSVFFNLLTNVAYRASQINDPIMNKLMFDLALYELPSPTSQEYGKLMKKIYSAADKQIKKELKS